MEIKKGKPAFIVSMHGDKLTGTIISIGRKYFVVDCGEQYDKFKFEIETLKDASGFGRDIYQSENKYNIHLIKRERRIDLNNKMIEAFKNRNNVSSENMEKIIFLLSESNCS